MQTPNDDPERERDLLCVALEFTTQGGPFQIYLIRTLLHINPKRIKKESKDFSGGWWLVTVLSLAGLTAVMRCLTFRTRELCTACVTVGAVFDVRVGSLFLLHQIIIGEKSY